MIKLFVILFAIVFIFPVSLGAEKDEIKPEAIVQKAPDVREESYAYEPGGRRDPFIPLVEVTKRKKAGKKPRTLGTLESYDIADFKLIAIVEKKGGQYYGLLLAADNKSFTIREGTVLGLNKGKVKEISPDKVLIEEFIRDYRGELKPRQVVLELRKREVE
jgi:Tfp pilus assembly protein PilP